MIDLPEDVDSGDFSMPKLEAGTYKVVVADATAQQSQSGNPMVKLTLRLVEGPGGKPATQDITVFENLVVISDRTSKGFKPCMDRIQKFRKAFGVSGKGLEPNDLKGKQGTAILKYEPSRKDPTKSYLQVDQFA